MDSSALEGAGGHRERCRGRVSDAQLNTDYWIVSNAHERRVHTTSGTCRRQPLLSRGGNVLARHTRAASVALRQQLLTYEPYQQCSCCGMRDAPVKYIHRKTTVGTCLHATALSLSSRRLSASLRLTGPLGSFLILSAHHSFCL